MITLWHRVVADVALVCAVIAANLGLIQGVIAVIAGLLAIAVYLTQLYQAWGKKDERGRID